MHPDPDRDQAFNKHKQRVFVHAEEVARARQGEVEPDIVKLYAATGMAGERAKAERRPDGSLVDAVPVMVLAGWEGYDQDVIDGKQGLSWQTEQDFISGPYRKYKPMFEQFLVEFNASDVVKEKGLTWGHGLSLNDKRFWEKKDRKVVVTVPGYEWVAKHPSCGERLVAMK